MNLTFTTWNCADGFARKSAYLNELDADFITVQEVRRPAFEQLSGFYRHAFYQQSNTARGIAVFSNLDADVSVLPMRLRKADHCYLAVQIDLPGGALDVLSAWVKPVEDYVRPSQRAFRAFFRASAAPYKIILGDLNQNLVFDRNRRLGLFAKTASQMAKHGLRSLYHEATSDGFGDESRPTHFLTYDKSRPYHLDYIFASQNLPLVKFELFSQDPWSDQRRSDHLPLRAQLEFPAFL
ncbi:MAG: endonuclease/exonuclease/phosphatase family protein [Rhodobacteraceae bacterium]|nr:endonuclease/exonuclease/phosphatase family protein [Paracoccaceae bacterium]